MTANSCIPVSYTANSPAQRSLITGDISASCQSAALVDAMLNHDANV